MLIVSQDKTMILNYENIEVIGIGNPLENNDGKFKILVETTSDNQYPIAEYETEKRANEVLQEIVGLYRRCQQVIGERGGIINFIYPPKVYEMPKE